MQKELDALVREVLPLDRSAMTAAEAYQARLAKPPGSLGRLEEISIQLAGITGRVHNALNKKQLLVFAADNGVVAEGVSSAPQSVTKQQTINLMRGKTGAAVLAKHFGCGLTVCDVGVNADIYESAVLNRKIAYGTQNICTGPAMTREQTLQAILTGAEIARTVDADVIGVGEMGIGNTTTSSAVAAVLLRRPVESMTGRGAGLSDAGLARKIDAIRRGVAVNRPDADDPLDVLAKLGGLDIAGLCGVFLGGALHGVPIVMDGFISGVAALCAVRLCPNAGKAVFASHASSEPAARLVLEALGKQPLLTADMHLGEGTGAVASIPLWDMALAVCQNCYSFEEGGIAPYTPQC